MTRLEAAVTTDDFESVASLGNKLPALRRESAQLPLSEEDYLTLPTRHAQLVARLTDKCTELALTEEYAALGPLGAKLKELRAAVPPEMDGDSAPSLPSGAIRFLPFQTL
jgi:hypothetical protein